MRIQDITRHHGAATTVVDTLAAWSREAPDEIALTVLHDGEQVGAQATYAQIHARALSIAAVLQEKCARGSRVLLLLPTGVEFVFAFFGCLAAGMIAVPANYPLQSRRKSQWTRLQAIADNSEARLVLTDAKSAALLRDVQSGHGLLQECELIEVETLRGPAAACAAPIAPDDIAFLQYTSGSTTLPKGVVITHENILNNQEVIASLMGHRPGLVVVSWLPLHHDMGLSAILQMASFGLKLVLMPPVTFIQKPLRWLQAISKYRAHTSGGPNFAYEVAAAELRSPAAESLDLSSWELAFCGAEPIRERTVKDFVVAAAPRGFGPNAFYPCYGLAESTVAVTGMVKGEGVCCLNVDQEALASGRLRCDEVAESGFRTLISCGSTRAGNEVRIVNPQTFAVCDDSDIGEIWVRGKSVGAGYWNNPSATSDTFAARLAGEDCGSWMRTGDLGALHDGGLFVTGRLKDLIIIRGRNLYPQDIEDTVQSSFAGLRKDSGAAFTVLGGEVEKLVIVQEVGRTMLRSLDSAAVFKAIVTAVVDEFAVTPHAIVLVQPATVDKTSSGKIQRALCRKRYLRNELQQVAVWTEERETASAPGSQLSTPMRSDRELAQRIRTAVAAHLKMSPVDISMTTPWAELGLDSVKAVRLIQSLQETLHVRLDSTVAWECANIEELTAYVAKLQKGSAVDVAAKSSALRAPATARTRNPEAVLQLSEAEATAALLEEISR